MYTGSASWRWDAKFDFNCDFEQEERSSKMQELTQLESQAKTVEQQLAEYADNDPERYQQMSEFVKLKSLLGRRTVPSDLCRNSGEVPLRCA